MEKNTILAVVLSMIVLFIWMAFFAPKPDETQMKNNNVPAKEQIVTENKNTAENIKEDIPLNSAASSTQALEITKPEEGAVKKIEGTITSAQTTFTFTSDKGRILKTHLTDKKYKNKNVDMFEALVENSYFPQMSSVFTEEPPFYTLKSKTDKSAEFVFSQNGITETKNITAKDDYVIQVTKTITNNSEIPVKYIPAVAINSQKENKALFNASSRPFDILLYADGSVHEADEKDDLNGIEQSKIKWAGINYGLFMITVMTDKNEGLTYSVDADKDKNLLSLKANLPEVTINPASSYSITFNFYVGPKELDKMEAVGSSLDQSVNFGMLSFLAKPMLWLLNKFYIFIGNYGIAIIFLTVLIKLILWPLSAASYKSMSKMKQLQPKLKELQQKYKDDKETLNRETMKLYQKDGVNPLGGCFPMFLQMPIYFALYKMLNNAVELYNAPFLPVWITDLSAKDPLYILPIILGITMFIQQKMMPQQMDNQQAKIMMYTMPLVFTFMMLWLPSGLVLYIMVNTILGIAQQKLIMRKYA